MSDYKLTKDCGLHVFTQTIETQPREYAPTELVLASELEAFLAKGVRVYNDGVRTDEYWDNNKYYKNTHSGLVVNFKKLPNLKPVNCGEVLQMLMDCKEHLNRSGFSMTQEYESVVERLKTAGVTP